MSYNPNLPAGQATMSASAPVVISSDQSAIPVSGTVAVTSATLATTAKQDTGNTSLSSIDGKITAVNTGAVVVSSSALPSGASTSAKQDTLLTELQLKADLTETQPVSLASVPSHPVTNAGTFAVQATEADGANVTLGAKADAKSTATDTTAVSAMSVLKQISASVQAPPSQVVTATDLDIRDLVNTDVVTAELSATDNAVLDAIAASVAAIDTDTTTIIGHVDGIETLIGTTNTTLGTIDTDTGNISTKIDTLAGAVSGTEVQVDIVASLPAGTNAIGKLSANSGVDIGDVDVTSAVITGGAVAHDGADSGNPIKVGGQARTTNPTAVADGDRSNFITDDLGKLVVVGSIRDLKGVQQTTITSSTSETTIVTAVASTFLDLYGLIITNTSATVTKVTIKDSTTGTTRAVFEIPATETRGFMLPESGGIPQASVNNNWTATCGTSVASVEITALYVKNI